MEWQTINTAPMDGTKILVWHPNGSPGGYPVMCLAVWDTELSHDGLWRIWGSWHELDEGSTGFTHWAQLPDPPSADTWKTRHGWPVATEDITTP